MRGFLHLSFLCCTITEDRDSRQHFNGYGYFSFLFFFKADTAVGKWRHTSFFLFCKMFHFDVSHKLHRWGVTKPLAMHTKSIKEAAINLTFFCWRQIALRFFRNKWGWNDAVLMSISYGFFFFLFFLNFFCLCRWNPEQTHYHALIQTGLYVLSVWHGTDVKQTTNKPRETGIIHQSAKRYADCNTRVNYHTQTHTHKESTISPLIDETDFLHSGVLPCQMIKELTYDWPWIMGPWAQLDWP